jgi:hypothetical protein
MRLWLKTDRKDFPPSRLATLTTGKKIFITASCNVEFEDSDIRNIPHLLHLLLAFAIIHTLSLEQSVKRTEPSTPNSTPNSKKPRRIASPTRAGPSTPSSQVKKTPPAMTPPPGFHTGRDESTPPSSTPITSAGKEILPPKRPRKPSGKAKDSVKGKEVQKD